MGGSGVFTQDQDSNPTDGWVCAHAGIEGRFGRDARNIVVCEQHPRNVVEPSRRSWRSGVVSMHREVKDCLI